MKGAAEILQLIPSGKTYDWIVCACGTGTTIAGLIKDASPRQHMLGINVLKNHTGLRSDIEALFEDKSALKRLFINDQYHFGGYAKYNRQLLDFMQQFYNDQQIPTDFVYTGKLMFAVNQLIRDGWFVAGCRILTIHSGGLQGNRSLKQGMLSF